MDEADKYRDILERDPADTQAFVGLCGLVEREGDFEYLAQLYEYRAQVIKDNKEISDLLFRAGEYYLDKVDDLTRGVEALLAGFEQDPTHGGIGDRLDSIYRDAGDWEAAVHILERRVEAIEAADKSGTRVVIRSDLHQQTGEIYDKALNDKETALLHYRRAIELDKTNIMALYAARDIYYNAGKFRNAAKLCELEAKAEKDLDRKMALYRELAHILSEHLSEHGQAVKALKRALKIKPDDTEIRIDIARTIAATPFEKKDYKDRKWAFEYLLRTALSSPPGEGIRLARLALMALPNENAKAMAYLEKRAKKQDAPEELAAAYEQIIEDHGALADKAPYIRKLVQLYVDELNTPDEALPWLKELESLGSEEDAALFDRLAAGQQVRKSQVPSPKKKVPPIDQTQEVTADEIVEERFQVDPMSEPPELDELLPPPSQPAPDPAPDQVMHPPVSVDTVDSHPPKEKPEGVSTTQFVTELHSQAERARRVGDDDAAEQHMLKVLEHAPQDPKATTYLERRFRSRGDWLALRNILMTSVDAEHIPPAIGIRKLREAARLSEEQLQDVDGAIAAWQLIHQTDNKMRDAVDALTRLLSQTERWTELLEIIEKGAAATKSRSKKIEAFQRIAEINLQHLNDNQAAAEAYRHILELTPDDAPALEALDDIYQRENQFEELVPLLRQRAERTRGREEKRDLLLRATIVLHEKLAQPKEAYALAEEILTISPNDDAVFDVLERINEEQQDWSRLIEILDARAKKSIDADARAEFIRKKANIHMNQLDDSRGAILAWNELLDVAGGDIEALDTLTKIYTDNDQWDNLVDILHKRIETLSEPTDKAEMYRQIARVQDDELNDSERAAESWRQVLELEEDPESLAALSRYYEQNEQWDELVDILRRQAPCAEDEQERAAFLFELASVLDQKLGERDEAITVLKQVQHEVDPANLDTLALLENIFVENDNFAEAADVVEQRIQYVEDAEEKKGLFFKIGNWAKQELEDLERSKEAFENAARIDQSDVKILEALQEVYIELGDQEKLLKLLYRRFQLADSDDQKLEFLMHGSKVCEEESQDHAKAWSWYRQAFDTLSHLDSVLPTIEEAAYRMEMWKELIDIYGILTNREKDPARQVEWWLKIVDIFEEKLEDPAQALEAGLRAFGLVPDDERLLDRVDQLAVNAQNWGRLATVYSVLTKRAEAKENKIELLVRYANLLADQAEQVSDAFDVSLKAFELEPGSEERLEMVERLGAKAARWEDLIKVYNVCAKLSDEVDVQVDFKLKAAEHYRDKLEDCQSALAVALEALNFNPFSEEVREKVWPLVRSLEEDAVDEVQGSYWNKLIELYLHHVHEKRNEHQEQTDLLLLIAEIEEAEKKDYQAAFNYLKQAQRSVPQEEKIVDQLETMAGEHGFWEELGDHYSDVLDETFEMNVAVIMHRKRARILEEELHRPEEAADHYWQIIQLDAQDEVAYQMLLAHYERSEQWNELVNLLERQLDSATDDKTKLRLLLQIAAIWKDNIGNVFEAKDWYEQALALDPDNDESKAELENLSKKDGDLAAAEKDDDVLSLVSLPVKKDDPPSEDEVADDDDDDFLANLDVSSEQDESDLDEGSAEADVNEIDDADEALVEDAIEEQVVEEENEAVERDEAAELDLDDESDDGDIIGDADEGEGEAAELDLDDLESEEDIVDEIGATDDSEPVAAEDVEADDEAVDASPDEALSEQESVTSGDEGDHSVEADDGTADGESSSLDEEDQPAEEEAEMSADDLVVEEEELSADDLIIDEGDIDDDLTSSLSDDEEVEAVNAFMDQALAEPEEEEEVEAVPPPISQAPVESEDSADATAEDADQSVAELEAEDIDEIEDEESMDEADVAAPVSQPPAIPAAAKKAVDEVDNVTPLRPDINEAPQSAAPPPPPPSSEPPSPVDEEAGQSQPPARPSQAPDARHKRRRRRRRK